MSVRHASGHDAMTVTGLEELAEVRQSSCEPTYNVRGLAVLHFDFTPIP
jgi:hypothetical protein